MAESIYSHLAIHLFPFNLLKKAVYLGTCRGSGKKLLKHKKLAWLQTLSSNPRVTETPRGDSLRALSWRGL